MTLEEVAVHPLAVLTVIDHYRRCSSGPESGGADIKGTTRKTKVVGALLGTITSTRADVLAAFAVPFEEDPVDPLASFLDHNYMEAMADLHKKVTAKERLIGWYKAVTPTSSISSSDSGQNPNQSNGNGLTWDEADAQLAGKLVNNYGIALFVVFDSTGQRAPQAFCIIPSSTAGTGMNTKGMGAHFQTVECAIEAEEAELVGVEHLLRDISEPPSGLLSTQVQRKLSSLRELDRQLADLESCLQKQLVNDDLDQDLLSQVQELLNDLPMTLNDDIQGQKGKDQQVNDQLVMTLVSTLATCTCTLYDAILTHIRNKENGVKL